MNVKEIIVGVFRFIYSMDSEIYGVLYVDGIKFESGFYRTLNPDIAYNIAIKNYINRK